VPRIFSVLYVDDEPDLLEIGRSFLQIRGEFSVETARSAQDGLTCLARQHYDAIISDYMMPDMNGIGFLQEVRETFGDIPFILFTGRGREEVVIEAINNGVDFYLQKGGDVQAQFVELADKLRKAIERKESKEALINSEKRLNDFINFLPDATLAIDRSGTVIAWNKAIEEMTGIPSREMIGKGNYEYAIPFYGDRRPILVDMIFRPDPESEKRYSPLIRKEGNTLIAEVRLTHPPGQVRDMFVKASPLPDKDGKIVVAIETIRDITTMKAAEAELASSRDYLQEIFSSVREGILVIDAHTHEIIDTNPAAARMIGAGRDEILGRVCHRFICPAEKGRCPITDLNQNVDNSEGILFTASGVTIPIIKYAVPFTFCGRECLLETIVDITEREHAEDELRAAYEQITASEEALRAQLDELTATTEQIRKSEELHRTLFLACPDGIVVTDARGTLTHVSPRALALFALSSPDEVIGTNVMEWIALEGRKTALDAIGGALSGREIPRGREFPAMRRDGSVFPAAINASILHGPDGAPAGLVAVIRDVSDHNATVQALRESEEKFRILLDESSDPVFSFYPDGTYRYVNRAFAEGVGKPQEWIIGRKIHDVFSPAEAEHRFSALREVFASGAEKKIEYRVPTPSGDHYYLTTITPIRDRRSAVLSVICSSKDITDRRLAEFALAERLHFQQALIDSIPHPIFIKDTSARFVGCNRAYERAFSITREYLIGKTVLDLEYLPGEERQRFQDEDLKTIRDAGRMSYELPIIYGDGATHMTLYSVDGFRLPDGKPGGLIGMLVDISDRKQLEVSLMRANRQLSLMTSITRHDIKNRITGILGYLGVARAKNTNANLDDYFRKLEAATLEVNTQIEFTKMYEDLGTHEPQWQNLQTIMPEENVPETLRFETDLDGTEVFADPMLGKVFANLLDNTVRHGQTAQRISVVARKSANGLVVIWEDDGIGVAADEKEKIFERGFGKNTGLGLFLVREILALTGITICETGKPGSGARFEIHIPEMMYRKRT
jgi:PAS domain S-box-containing protein